MVTLETNRFREECLRAFLKENGLDERVKIIQKGFHELTSQDLSDIKVREQNHTNLLNRLKFWKINLKTLNYPPKKIDFILSECSFNHALLPWDNFYFYNALKHFLSNVPNASEIKVLPVRMKIYAIAISMENLDKIRSPVGSTEGFDISEFDKVILVNS